MIKNRMILVILFIWPFINLFSQPMKSNYVIIQFESSYKITMHIKTTYYWIISTDSIKELNAGISPLIIDGYTKNNLTDCCSDKTIDPFFLNDSSNYNFSRDHLDDTQLLADEIKSGKKLVQVITVKWMDGQSEKINVYAIPITGRFCECLYKPIGHLLFDYQGRVFIPYSSFKLDSQFWKSELSNFLMHRDFSNFKFNLRK